MRRLILFCFFFSHQTLNASASLLCAALPFCYTDKEYLAKVGKGQVISAPLDLTANRPKKRNRFMAMTKEEIQQQQQQASAAAAVAPPGNQFAAAAYPTADGPTSAAHPGAGRPPSAAPAPAAAASHSPKVSKTAAGQTPGAGGYGAAPSTPNPYLKQPNPYVQQQPQSAHSPQVKQEISSPGMGGGMRPPTGTFNAVAQPNFGGQQQQQQQHATPHNPYASCSSTPRPFQPSAGGAPSATVAPPPAIPTQWQPTVPQLQSHTAQVIMGQQQQHQQQQPHPQYTPSSAAAAAPANPYLPTASHLQAHAQAQQLQQAVSAASSAAAASASAAAAAAAPSAAPCAAPAAASSLFPAAPSANQTYVPSSRSHAQLFSSMAAATHGHAPGTGAGFGAGVTGAGTGAAMGMGTGATAAASASSAAPPPVESKMDDDLDDDALLHIADRHSPQKPKDAGPGTSAPSAAGAPAAGPSAQPSRLHFDDENKAQTNGATNNQSTFLTQQPPASGNKSKSPSSLFTGADLLGGSA